MKKLMSFPLIALAIAACNQPAGSTAKPEPAAPGAAAEASPKAAAAPAQAAPAPQAKIGQPAPDFTLTDLDGKTHKLSDYKGKTVVLEWFNPGCPFVKQSHAKGGLKDLHAQEVGIGVVWLAINSGASGKQGAAKEDNVKAKAEWAMGYPILMDEKGEVGRAYGAKRTPHMFIVDPKGTLVYAGAIDSTKGGEPEPDEKVTNYVEVALKEIAAGKPVSTAQTEAFGCSVKY